MTKKIGIYILTTILLWGNVYCQEIEKKIEITFNLNGYVLEPTIHTNMESMQTLNNIIKRVETDSLFYITITSITIEESETEITLPLRIFNACTALESLDIPSNVVATADYLLYSNTMMNTIICRATTPPTTMSNDFGGISSTGVNGYVGALVTGDKILYVPTESVEAYKAKATDGTDNIVESTDADGNITTNENYWKTVLIDVCGFEVKPITD